MCYNEVIYHIFFFSPEEKIKVLEKKVNELIEESCVAASHGEFPAALEKAKEAGKKERMLVKQREQLAATDAINLDLTYSVNDFNCLISSSKDFILAFALT